MLASPVSLPLTPPSVCNASVAQPCTPNTAGVLMGGMKQWPCKVLQGGLVKNYSTRPYTADKVDPRLMDSSPSSKSYQRDDDTHPDLRKTRMCPNFTSVARCPLSSNKCRFAHSNEELRVSYDRYYKVQPCAFYDRGKCRNGEYCRFAHGRHELRTSLRTSAPVGEHNGCFDAARDSSLPLINSKGPLLSEGRLTKPIVPGSKAFDLGSFLSTQRHKRQSLVSFVSRHSRRRSDATCGGQSASTAGGVEDTYLLKSEEVATCSGGSPDGSPLGGRSTGLSSHDTWSDFSPATLISSSSETSPARGCVAAVTKDWERTSLGTPVLLPAPPCAVQITSLSMAIRASLTSLYKD